MINFNTPLQKLPKNLGRFGQINCSQMFSKVAQSPKIARSGHTASTLACLIFLCLADLGSGKDAWVLFGVMVQWLFPNWNDLCVHFIDSIVSSTTYKHLSPVGGTAAGPLPSNLRTQVRVPYHAKIWICQRRPMLKTHYSCLTSKWHNFFQVTASVII